MRTVQRLLVVVALLFAALTAADAQAAPQSKDFPSLAGKLKVRDYSVGGQPAESLLVVHYRRPGKDFTNWNLWVWPEGGEGAQSNFGGEDAFGRYAIVPFAQTPARAGFIIRRGNWEEKDFDQDRFVPMRKGEVTEIWVTAGVGEFTTDPNSIDTSTRIHAAFLDALDSITLVVSGELDARAMRGVSVERRGDSTRVRGKPMRLAGSSGGRTLYEIPLAAKVAAEDVGRLMLAFDRGAFGPREPMTVYARGALEDPLFTASDARLGAFATAESTRFATWSPVAERVELLLDEGLGERRAAEVVPLARGAAGVWQATVAGDLHGRPYRYRFTHYGAAREVPDMHAFAASADSLQTVVADLSRVEPEGFRTTPFPRIARATDEVIYEIHVRDYSIRDARLDPSLRGTYLGLIHEAPADPASGTVSSGLSHLLELGVTAVHLLPVHDFTARVDEYNWGYWTTLFNVAESNYSTRPADPMRAILDLRTAVTALHAAGVRVILDVVYNHTSSAGPESPFGGAVPYYFFRTTPDGRFTNDSGTGNGFADERPMARKYIVDSLAHWLEEYKVDGFRFDLLGCHKPETVRAICARVKAIRPDATLYGEPWTGGGPIHFGKGAQKGLPIAVFNDHLRNAIRGDLDGTASGFATGPGGDTAAIRRGVRGAIEDFTQHPTETVNYASAHDNLTLWDKIVKTQPALGDATRRMMQKLAIGVVLTSQGVPFLHGGCEFARTKGGNHNSYDAGDDVNHFDWGRKAAYLDLFDYTKGLIALRREHPAFRMAEAADVRRAVSFADGAGPVAFTIDGSVAGDAWSTILVAYNHEPREVRLALPPGDWTVVVDATRAGTAPLGTARAAVTLAPYSMLVAYRD